MGSEFESLWEHMKNKKPRKYSYVKFKKPYYEFRDLIYLGDIPNAPSHCLLAEAREKRDKRGVQQWDIIGMFHTSDLVELTEDEL